MKGLPQTQVGSRAELVDQQRAEQKRRQAVSLRLGSRSLPLGSQIGLAAVIEKIVSNMQMRRGSESASHADNFYVDNLP